MYWNALPCFCLEIILNYLRAKGFYQKHLFVNISNGLWKFTVFIFLMEWFLALRICENLKTFVQGRSQDFSKRGSQRLLTRSPSGDRRLYIWFIPLLSLVYQRAQSRSRLLSRIIAAWMPILTKDKSRWREYFTKKQIFKKWAFQQWLLRPRYCHGVFTTWIL